MMKKKTKINHSFVDDHYGLPAFFLTDPDSDGYNDERQSNA